MADDIDAISDRCQDPRQNEQDGPRRNDSIGLAGREQDICRQGNDQPVFSE